MSVIALENTLWVEKYRPKNLSEYIGNNIIKEDADKWIKTNDIPHLLLYGKAGTGKTSLGKILVKTIDCDVLYINASDENNVETIRTKIKNFVSSVGFKALKVVFLDEADGLTPSAQGILRNIMEQFSKHSRFILTCNYVEKVIDPIQSRCATYQIHPPSKNEIAKRIVEICKLEEVGYDLESIKIIVNKGYPDIRRVINLLQQSSSSGKLVISKQASLEFDYMDKILEVLKEKKDAKTLFLKIRQIIADSKVRTFDDLYRYLYDNLDSFAPNGTQAPVILHIAKAMQSDVFCVDKEINIMAMFIEILTELKG